MADGGARDSAGSGLLRQPSPHPLPEYRAREKRRGEDEDGGWKMEDGGRSSVRSRGYEAVAFGGGGALDVGDVAVGGGEAEGGGLHAAGGIELEGCAAALSVGPFEAVA